jgi:NAD(P)-dependent dehydrogenase (short-subunit alcohol dehydrogenase family)
VDLADPASIRALYDASPPLDAVVSTAGIARFGPFTGLSDEDYAFSLRNKLMGNVNLVRFGLGRIAPGGSFTLTTGSLTHQPTPEGAVASMVGGALESWVKAAALELWGRYRINAVSPGWVTETLEKLDMDPTPGIPADELAGFYQAVVEGTGTGVILRP